MARLLVVAAIENIRARPARDAGLKVRFGS